MDYHDRIRWILSSKDNFHSETQRHFSPPEREQIITIIDNIESDIEKFWAEYDYGKDNIDEQWVVWVLAEAMENLVHEMELKKLSKTFGKIESEADQKCISTLHDDLHRHIVSLKEVCSSRD